MIFKYPTTKEMQDSLHSLEKQGYTLKNISIDKLIKDNNLDNQDELNYRTRVWGNDINKYSFNNDAVNKWSFSDGMYATKRSDKYILGNGKHRVRALANSGYDMIELPIKEDLSNNTYTVYHGSQCKDLKNNLRPDYMYFTNDKNIALDFAKGFAFNYELNESDVPTLYLCEIKINNPLVVKDEDEWENYADASLIDNTIRELQDKGYDGVILKEENNITYYLVFNAKEQVIDIKQVSTIEEAYKSDDFKLYTAGYIDTDGTYIYMSEYHGEEESKEYRDLGLPEFSSTHWEEDTCVRLCKEPNAIQYEKLEKIIDAYLDNMMYCKVEIGSTTRNCYENYYKVFEVFEGACSDFYGDDKREVGNWTGYDLVKKIKEYLNNSKLSEELTENNNIVESISTNQQLLKNANKYMYHVTDKRHLKNILENGLTHFWFGDDPVLCGDLVLHNHNDYEDYVIIEIETSKLKPELCDLEIEEDCDYFSIGFYRGTINVFHNIYWDETDEMISDKELDEITTNRKIVFEELTENDITYDDNEGNVLSREQVNFFKNSKIRDDNNNLIVVYHGTNDTLSSFDNFIVKTAPGIWFTEDYEYANEFGRNVYKCEVRFDNVYNLEENDLFKLMEKHLKRPVSEEDILSFECRDYLKSLGYDGLCWEHSGSMTYVAFNSNQVRLISNRDNLNENAPSEKEGLLEEVYETESATIRLYTSKNDCINYLRSCTEEQRIYIEQDDYEDTYVIATAYETTHTEMLAEVNIQGYYFFTIDDYNKDNICLLYVPNTDEFFNEESEAIVDDYDTKYIYDDFVIYSRYQDFEHFSLCKSLGKYKKERIK